MMQAFFRCNLIGCVLCFSSNACIVGPSASKAFDTV